MTTAPTHFVRIDRAHCKNCGDKRALRVNVGSVHMPKIIERDIPVTLDAAVVERTPWRCQCGLQVSLDIEVVE